MTPRAPSAKAAGLSDCFSHDQRFFIPDAVRAPVFAEQLARLDRRLLRRIKDIDLATADSPGELAVAFRNCGELIDSAVDGIDRLDPRSGRPTRSTITRSSCVISGP